MTNQAKTHLKSLFEPWEFTLSEIEENSTEKAKSKISWVELDFLQVAKL